MPSPKGSPRSPAATAEADDALPRIDSPSLEVLESLELQNAVTNLEARLDSLEIDIARQTGTREDDSRRMAGEMAVMKARVEDALHALDGTAEELRVMVRTVEERLDDVVKRAFDDEHPAAAALRAELRAQIDGVMAGVGDVLESVAAETGKRIESLADQMREIQTGMLKVAEHIGALTPMTGRMAELEAAVARLLGDRDPA